jgi:alpha-1,6-mannosyltransferase
VEPTDGGGADPARRRSVVSLVRRHTALAVLAAACTGRLLLRGDASLGARMGLTLVAYLAFALVVAGEVVRPLLGRRLVVGAVVALLAVSVLAPPRESRDLWLYGMYGRIVAEHHDNPYTHVPALYRDDPWYDRLHPAWRHATSLYGPAFVAVAAAGMHVWGNSLFTGRLFFQALAALAVLAAALAVGHLTGSAAAMAVVGLNPLVLLSVVNGGHNDALIGLAVIVGAMLAARRRFVGAGMVLALAVLVKATASLALLGVAVWVLRREGVRKTAAVAGTAALVVVGGYLLAGGQAPVQRLHDAQLDVSGASVWDTPRRLLTLDQVADGVPYRRANLQVRQGIARWSMLAVLALAGLTLLRGADRLVPAAAAGGAILAYLLLGAYVLPWYLAWGLPALALAWRAPVAWLTLGYGALLHLAYIPVSASRSLATPPLATVEQAQETLRLVGVPLLCAGLTVLVVLGCLRRNDGVTGVGDSPAR